MATIESTLERLVLKAGATMLVLDKGAGEASLHRKGLLWDRKPVNIALADLCGVSVTPALDRSCGFASSYVLIVARSGNHIELPAMAKASAEEAAQSIREFLELNSR